MVKKGTLASPAMARASRVLPVPGGPDHQHALGDLAAELLELAGVTEEVHHLRDLLLGLLGPGHILEGDLDLVLGQHARPALAEGHGPAPAHAALHLAHEEDPEPDQDKEREPVDQDRHQHDPASRGAGH